MAPAGRLAGRELFAVQSAYGQTPLGDQVEADGDATGEIGLAADVLMGPSVAPSVATRQLRVRIEALGFDKHVEVAGGSRSLSAFGS